MKSIYLYKPFLVILDSKSIFIQTTKTSWIGMNPFMFNPLLININYRHHIIKQILINFRKWILIIAEANTQYTSLYVLIIGSLFNGKTWSKRVSSLVCAATVWSLRGMRNKKVIIFVQLFDDNFCNKPSFSLFLLVKKIKREKERERIRTSYEYER